jgi:hypothetical protein
MEPIDPRWAGTKRPTASRARAGAEMQGRERERIRGLTTPEEKPRVRVPAGSAPRPRVRVPAGSSPVTPTSQPPAAARAAPATAPGGSGPPSVPPRGGALVPAGPPPRPPAASAPQGGAVQAVPRGAIQRAQTVIDGDPPRTPRDVPSTRVPPAQLPAPEPPPSTRAPVASNVARRRGLGALGPAAVVLGELQGTPVADATLPPDQRYQGPPLERQEGDPREPNTGLRSERVQEATNPDAPASPDGVTYAPVREERPARRPPRRVSGGARAPRASDADRLNELSLRAIRGEAGDGSAEDQNIRRRMRELSGMKAGGAVKAKESYASGGCVGGKHDGAAIRGKTRGRFI